jgi:Ni/Fe-hydrogenase subunit HybB-like protein
VALIGASAGAFGFAAVIFTLRKTEYYGLARLAMLVAFGAFAAGMTNVWLDLGHPFRFWKLTDADLVDVDHGLDVLVLCDLRADPGGRSAS